MYIIWGLGNYGRACLEMIGTEKVAYIVDNDSKKRNPEAAVPVYTFSEKKNELKAAKDTIVVAVSAKYAEEISRQLGEAGISGYESFADFQRKITQKKAGQKAVYEEATQKALKWIEKHSIFAKGIAQTSVYQISYPEVTGYYIPSLLKHGKKELALKYAKWLCSMQKKDGSYYDIADKAAYTFDTAQILKGLLAIRKDYPAVDEHIIRGCDWILSNMEADGRLGTPTKETWIDAHVCNDLTHIYCLSPIKEAGEIFARPDYLEKVQQILHYYLENQYERIVNFSLLSHFYAYIMEGLLDMGEEAVAREAMENIAKYQKEDGSVPAYHNVNWVCSTGLMQLALVWFRLGNNKRGERALQYACRMQNASGGWFGSYLHPQYPAENNDYFPLAEISWANKYFLDAVSARNK